MKKSLLSLVLLLMIGAATAQVKYVDGLSLTMINKLGTTTKPYERIETDKYELNNAELVRLRFSAGLGLVFETDSPYIDIRTKYVEYTVKPNMSTIGSAGYDLYVQTEKGDWRWAHCGVAKEGEILHLIKDMEPTMKRFLLYLPTWSRLESVEVGVDEKAEIKASENPFRHRILIIGSSFTHGDGVSRSGMPYPIQLERATGLQFITLGVSGQSRLQPFFADIINDNEIDAVILDAFSNPSAEMIEERLIPFIERVRAQKPDLPMIFLRSIHRERSNYNLTAREMEQSKDAMATKLMKEVVKNYKDIYFVDVTNQTGTDHETSIDGVHPGDFGYWRWANTIRPHIVKILKKYDLK